MRKTLALFALTLLIPSALAVDLTKIERAIRKEPAYQSKTPRYCLLVFGPEAKTRVWLVLDGKRLFVDRNGNGDLTDDGEPIAAKKGLERFGSDGQVFFEAGDISDGPRTHETLTVTFRKLESEAWRSDKLKKWVSEAPEGRGCSLRLAVDWQGYQPDGGRKIQVAGPYDDKGIFVFADKPRSAPILHLGGPLRIVCDENSRLLVGREKDLMLSITTPGLGVGTTATLVYTAIPETASPHIEIIYPSEKPGQPPLKRHYDLKERC